MKYVLADADASYVHLDVTFRDAVPDAFTIAADAVAGRSPATTYRIAVVAGGRDGAGQRRAAPSTRSGSTRGRPADAVPDVAAPFHPFRLMVNRSLVVGRQAFPAEFQDVGALRRGTWDPDAAGYDSLGTWQVDRGHDTVHLRLPWSMLGMADPSSRTALGPGDPAHRREGRRASRSRFEVPGSADRDDGLDLADLELRRATPSGSSRAPTCWPTRSAQTGR